jgi:hypothetical protein
MSTHLPITIKAESIYCKTLLINLARNRAMARRCLKPCDGQTAQALLRLRYLRMMLRDYTSLLGSAQLICQFSDHSRDRPRALWIKRQMSRTSGSIDSTGSPRAGNPDLYSTTSTNATLSSQSSQPYYCDSPLPCDSPSPQQKDDRIALNVTSLILSCPGGVSPPESDQGIDVYLGDGEGIESEDEGGRVGGHTVCLEGGAIEGLLLLRKTAASVRRSMLPAESHFVVDIAGPGSQSHQHCPLTPSTVQSPVEWHTPILLVQPAFVLHLLLVRAVAHVRLSLRSSRVRSDYLRRCAASRQMAPKPSRARLVPLPLIGPCLRSPRNLPCRKVTVYLLAISHHCTSSSSA